MNGFLKKTEKWFELSSGYELFVAASSLISEYQLADAGFFVYKKRLMTGVTSDPIDLYRPWGDFAEIELANLHQFFSLEHMNRLHPFMEKWSPIDQVPSLHHAWIGTKFTHLGIWPFTSSDQQTGALVVSRKFNTIHELSLEESNWLLNVCAYQVSNAINAMLNFRKMEFANRQLEKEIQLRKLAELELERDAKIQMNLINNMSIGVFLASLDRTILMANHRITEIFGYEIDELVGQNFRTIYHNDDAYHQFSSYYYLLASSPNGITDQQFMFQRKNGSLFSAEVSGAFLDPEDPSKGVIWTIKDISEKLAMENQIRLHNERMQHELRLAGSLQHAFLPKNLPSISGILMAWKYIPSDFLAGDMLNIIALDDTHLGLFVLDVMGHGVSAALSAIAINYYLRPLENDQELSIARHPGTLLTAINERFSDFSNIESYFTIFYGVLDLNTMELVYSNGGHPSPIVVHENGIIDTLQEGDIPLGINKGTRFSTYSWQLNFGDKLLVYSDGLTEVFNQEGEMFSIKRVKDFLTQYRELDISSLTDQLINEITLFTGQSQWSDDVTLVGMDIQPRSVHK